jgi:hypothetical protein
MPSYYDYEDYESIIDDTDELYSYDDQWDYDDVEMNEQTEWENYYHNIADELTDE